MSEYGIPHPIHTVFAAERIVVESIPSLTFAEVGITPGLSDVLETSGISTVGQLSNPMYITSLLLSITRNIRSSDSVLLK